MSNETQVKRPKLGQWCSVKGCAVKNQDPCNKTYPSGGSYLHHIKTTWERVELPAQQMMYIGKRTVQDGEYGNHGGFDGESYEEAIYFHATKHHEVWLFVKNANQNPIRVFPCDVELKAEG